MTDTLPYPTMEDRIRHLEARIIAIEYDMRLLKDRNLFILRFDSASQTMRYVDSD